MSRWLVSLSLLVVICVAPGVSAADPYDNLRRPDGTLPAKYDNLDRMHAGIAGAEVIASRGRSGARMHMMRMVMPMSRDYADHDDVTSIGIEGMTAEVLDVNAGDPRDYSIWQALGFQLRYDTASWGVAAGLHLLSAVEDEELSVITPHLGFRLGSSDGVLVAVDARAAGMHVVSSRAAGRTLAENFDIDVRANAPVTRVLHAQLRARRRNHTATDEVLDETLAVLGLEAAIDIGFRFVPVFFGAGVRHVGQHSRQAWDSERLMQRLGQTGDSGTQFVAMLELQLGFHGSNTLW